METALQLVDTEGNYEGYYFVIFDPDNSGQFFVVTAADGGPFDGTGTNFFGGSNELPPAAVPGEAPGTEVQVPNNPLGSLFLAQSVINPALPVELTTFTGRHTGKIVLLEWTTQTEDGNAGFELQRNAANGEFVTIGEVAGAGDSRPERNYTFTDLTAATGKNYYRLKQLDFSGAFAYSEVTIQGVLDANNINLIRRKHYLKLVD
jgi:hypothetical protein